MKKGSAFVLAVMIVLVFSATAGATGLQVDIPQTELELAADGTGSFQIEVDAAGKSYNSVQFELLLDADVSITGVSYNQNGARFEPQSSANGFTYFCLYTSDEEEGLQGNLVCTVRVRYGGQTEQELMIRKITMRSIIGVQNYLDESYSGEAKIRLIPPGGSSLARESDGSPDSDSDNDSDADDDGADAADAAALPLQQQIADPETPLGAAAFTDVAENSWAYPYIHALAAQGFVTGRTAGSFAPAEPITRAEFVMILARMSGTDLPAAYSGPFADIEPGSYYEGAVAWAVQAGITLGTAQDSFSPHRRIARQEIAVMIARYASFQRITFTKEQTAVSFTDSALIQPYAQEPVSLMQQAGIISGYADGSFRPRHNATRAEVAKMLALAQAQH